MSVVPTFESSNTCLYFSKTPVFAIVLGTQVCSLRRSLLRYTTKSGNPGIKILKWWLDSSENSCKVRVMGRMNR